MRILRWDFTDRLYKMDFQQLRERETLDPFVSCRKQSLATSSSDRLSVISDRRALAEASVSLRTYRSETHRGERKWPRTVSELQQSIVKPHLLLSTCDLFYAKHVATGNKIISCKNKYFYNKIKCRTSLILGRSSFIMEISPILEFEYVAVHNVLN